MPLPLQTADFVDQLFDAIAAHGVTITDAAGLKTAAVDLFTAWLGGSEAIPADLGQKLATQIGVQTAKTLNDFDWYTVPLNGGPRSDGTIDFVLPDGTTAPLDGRAKLIESLAKGDPGGVNFTFSTTQTDADPGAGKVRFNDVPFHDATVIYFDNTERGGATVTDWLGSFGSADGDVKGLLYFQEVETAKIAVFKVTGVVVDATGYRKVPVEFAAGVSAFANDARVAVTFTRTGPSDYETWKGLPGNSSGTKADYIDWQVDQVTDNAAAVLTPLKDAASTSATLAAAAQILAAATVAKFYPSSQSYLYAITDDYGHAVETVSSAGDIQQQMITPRVANLSAVNLTGGGALAGVADPYGLGVWGIDGAGRMRALSLRIDGSAIFDGAVAFNALGATSLTTDTIGSSAGDFLAAFVDSYGLAVVKVTPTGITTPAITAGAATVGSLAITGSIGLEAVTTAQGAGVPETIADAYGLGIAAFDAAGVRAPNIAAMRSWQRRVDPRKSGVWDYERNLLVSYGQSNSVGVQATPAISTTQPYGTLMLSCGVRTYSASPYGSYTLTPLVEADVSGDGETVVSGSSQFLNALVAAENGISFDAHAFAQIGAATGVASTALSGLVKGQTAYTRMMAVVQRCFDLCVAGGYTFAGRAMNFVHGETDTVNLTAGATYQAGIIQLRSDYDADVKAISGQALDAHMFLNQTDSHSGYGVATPTIALAQLAASQADAHLHLVAPMYFVPRPSGSVHMTSVGAKWFGAYFGLAQKRVLIDGQTWKPLAPKSKLIQGAACILVFDVPVAPLKLDIDLVSNPGDYGFDLVDSGGTSLTISSVTLAGPDRVKIVAASTIPAGAKVRYAWKPGPSASPGPKTGPRGNLRDSQGDVIPLLDPGGLNLPMHNWCVIFEI